VLNCSVQQEVKLFRSTQSYCDVVVAIKQEADKVLSQRQPALTSGLASAIEASESSLGVDVVTRRG